MHPSYPADNCNGSSHVDPQSILEPIYLNHQAIQLQNNAYVNSTTIAQQLGKPFLLFETNTASCGGFSGLSDSFAATLWGIDYALNMAMGNISHALFHVGGQSDYYNVSLSICLIQTLSNTFFSLLRRRAPISRLSGNGPSAQSSTLPLSLQKHLVQAEMLEL